VGPDGVGTMEPEREVATVHGLGRGSLLGFSLIVTDRKSVGIDTRRSSIRLWLGMMLGLGLGMILVLLVLFSGLEPVLFRISPLLSFVTMLPLVISLPILMLVFVPRRLGSRISRTGRSTVQALKKDIIRIEVSKPGRLTEQGYFTVRLMNGSSFTFWTVGRDMFDHANSVLTSFAPRQISDSSISTGQFTDREPDRPNNRLLASLIASVILLIVISGGILSSYVTFAQEIDFIVGAMMIHIIVTIGFLLLRRSKRRQRARC